MANYIRFDWAMKRLLRNKANYAVLEGLLTTLLKEKVTILLPIDSTSYADDDIPKHFRMNFLIANEKDEWALVEIQNNNEYAYYQRILFGLSCQLTDFINCYPQGYNRIRKVYSVNIVYFPLAWGKDYLYHGKTDLQGVHTGDWLKIAPFQKQTFQVDKTSLLYPEYYVLAVHGFDQIPTNPLEEWIYYLNTGEMPDKITASGLDTVKQQLLLEQLGKEDMKAYECHLNNLAILRNNLRAEYEEGRAEGIQETASNLKKMGMDVDFIVQATSLSQDEIEKLKIEN